jgi:hypothetical protein
LERDYNPFVKNSCRRDLALEGVFKSFNNRYFQGRLARYQILVCSKSKHFSHMSAGYCSSDARKIFIRSGISMNSTLQTLMHEMVHAKLWWLTKNVHGRAFVNELKRVRQLGAPLSTSELDLTTEIFFEVPRVTRPNLKKSIRYALRNEDLPPKYVPKFLELEFNLPYSAIELHISDVSEMIEKMSHGDD